MRCNRAPGAALLAAATAGMLATAAAAAPQSSRLLPGQVLKPGESLTDGNGFLVMQHDGDLCVCAALSPDGGSCGTKKLWSSGSAGHPGAYAEMQEMGVLSVLPPGYPEVCHDTDCRLWQSHTMAKAGCEPKSTNCSFVEMQKDGNAVMYKGSNPGGPSGPSIWSTGTKVMPTGTKNVLWMIADDMRPDMNAAYGQKHMLTPAFDRLAKEGSVFTRAYCQIAVCAPSRNSFMSGLRPDVTGIFNFANHIREPGQAPIVTVPQQFRDWGYTTLGGGKTFHYNLRESCSPLLLCVRAPSACHRGRFALLC
jgi:hypothetical protein